MTDTILLTRENLSSFSGVTSCFPWHENLTIYKGFVLVGLPETNWDDWKVKGQSGTAEVGSGS